MAIKAHKVGGCRVLANDLNPDCYHYLRKNIVLNKCADYVIPFCMDAREFMYHVVQQTKNEDVLSKSAVPLECELGEEEKEVKRKKKDRRKKAVVE